MNADGTEFLRRTVVEKHIGGVWFAVPQLSDSYYTSDYYAANDNLKSYAPSTNVLWIESASEIQIAK